MSDVIVDAVCEWCGDVGCAEVPLSTCIMSPPVSGHRVETARMHEHCANEAGAFAVAQ